MCGIAGICGAARAGGRDGRLRSMLSIMAHRGPDGEGTWADPAGRCLLGHRRLAIIDPAGGRQPLANEDGTVWIAFNGCIYNYVELAGELARKGHRFRTHSDTEVVVHAYEEWGPECAGRFNGMWGFALWDARDGTLFCSRDRLGVKPFYYVWDGRTFTFASEIKALLAAGAVRPEVDPDGLRQYLAFQFCLGETTMFRGVRKLPPGHNLVLGSGAAPRVSCFWDFSFGIDERHDEAFFTERLGGLLEDAVRLRLRSDVPLGAHLSGGLDSSTVVALCRRLLGEAPIKTFTGAFRDGAAFDETAFARLASRAAGTEYHEIFLSPADFTASIEKIVWHMDEPAAGPGIFPQYWVAKLASEHVKVVLGGQGGDEIFIGYARYLLAYLEECLRGAIEDTAGRGRYVATLESIVPSLPTLQNYLPMLKAFWGSGLFDEPARRYYALMDRFADARAILSPDLRIDGARTFAEFREIFEGHGAAAEINRIMRFDVKAHLQSLLHVEDRTSMAWGLESRTPLLDYRLVELLASVPPVIKFKNGRLKSLFRGAVRDLVPPEVLERKDKMGFPVPLSQWLRGELRPFAADILLSQASRGRGLFDPRALEAALGAAPEFGRSLWGALALELWHRQFIDGGAARGPNT